MWSVDEGKGGVLTSKVPQRCGLTVGLREKSEVNHPKKQGLPIPKISTINMYQNRLDPIKWKAELGAVRKLAKFFIYLFMHTFD